MNDQEALEYYNNTKLLLPERAGNYAAITSLDTKTTVRSVCHGFMKRSGSYNITHVDEGDVLKEREGIHALINYMVTESPFADGFLVKDSNTILEKGFLITPDVSPGVYLGACQVARSFSNEYRNSVRRVASVLEDGYDEVSPMVWFLLFTGNTLTINGDNSVGLGGTVVGNSGHLPVPRLELASQLLNYDKVSFDQKKTYRETKNWADINFRVAMSLDALVQNKGRETLRVILESCVSENDFTILGATMKSKEDLFESLWPRSNNRLLQKIHSGRTTTISKTGKRKINLVMLEQELKKYA